MAKMAASISPGITPAMNSAPMEGIRNDAEEHHGPGGRDQDTQFHKFEHDARFADGRASVTPFTMAAFERVSDIHVHEPSRMRRACHRRFTGRERHLVAWSGCGWQRFRAD